MILSIFKKFFLKGAFFLSLGIALIILTQKIEEVTLRYDETCFNYTNCKVFMNLTNKMEPPVFIYYEMENFFQNHRRYVKSRDADQLKGTKKTKDELSLCSPIITMKDLGLKNMKSVDGTQLKDDDPAHPCGLIAKSFFNGNF